MLDTLESEEDREKKEKLEETCKGKLTRPSEDAMFLRKEIIDALKRSDEKWKVTQGKPTKRWNIFYTKNLRFSWSTITRDGLSHGEKERRRIR